MERTVYGVISRLASVVLIIVGALAIWGASTPMASSGTNCWRRTSPCRRKPP